MSAFSANLSRFARKGPEQAKVVRDGVALKLFAAVVQDTPVDTGRLRANWQASINTPIRQAIDGGSDTGGQGEDYLEAATIAKAEAVIESSPVEDCAIIFTNNLPYAERIENDRWSHTKAPEGMMKRNVERFQEIVNKAGLNL